MRIAIKYVPETLALADKPTFVSATDGDTPTIQTPIRMLGMDAPELHYGGATAQSPGKFDAAFSTFLAGAGQDLDAGLKRYLAARLDATASTRHIQAGGTAFAHYQQIVAERLRRVSDKTGKELTPRKLFTMVSEQVFDRYGRMLAYVAPAYEKEELKAIPAAQRPTFNLQMMQDGHAVSLIIYPNIPGVEDLALVHGAISDARRDGKGIWKSRTPVLHAFEFRWIIDMLGGKRAGPDRFCGDFTNGKLYAPQKYYLVPEEARLWFYAEDVAAALGMGFKLQI